MAKRVKLAWLKSQILPLRTWFSFAVTRSPGSARTNIAPTHERGSPDAVAAAPRSRRAQAARAHMDMDIHTSPFIARGPAKPGCSRSRTSLTARAGTARGGALRAERRMRPAGRCAPAGCCALVRLDALSSRRMSQESAICTSATHAGHHSAMGAGESCARRKRAQRTGRLVARVRGTSCARPSYITRTVETSVRHAGKKCGCDGMKLGADTVRAWSGGICSADEDSDGCRAHVRAHEGGATELRSAARPDGRRHIVRAEGSGEL